MLSLILTTIHKHKLFIKYCVVGGTAAVVDFSVLYFLTEWGEIYYLYSATASFILSALTNYSLNRKWTFRSNGKKRKQLPIFFFVAICGLLLNNTIMYIGVEEFNLWYIFAKILATAIVLIWNFLGNKHFTFNDK